MALFKWDDKYTVKDEELDNHHKALFAILNRLYLSCFEEKDVIKLDSIYEELISYINYHFSAEEQHMRDIGYNYIDEHIIVHNMFKEKILQLQQNVHIDTIEVTKELIVYLGKWLLHHVIVEDKKYSK
jgi:hemerythrin-like metal-binding protein